MNRDHDSEKTQLDAQIKTMEGQLVMCFYFYVVWEYLNATTWNCGNKDIVYLYSWHVLFLCKIHQYYSVSVNRQRMMMNYLVCVCALGISNAEWER